MERETNLPDTIEINGVQYCRVDKFDLADLKRRVEALENKDVDLEKMGMRVAEIMKRRNAQATESSTIIPMIGKTGNKIYPSRQPDITKRR